MNARRSHFVALSALFTGLFGARSALAGGPLGPEGAPLETSRYSVDLYQTAVWAGSKVTSLGGSYVALAYDVDGMLQNPAAPAVRPFFSVSEFDYWLGFGVTVPSSVSGMDFFNNGSKLENDETSSESLVYVTPAAIFQFGNLGVGVNFELQSYGIGQKAAFDGKDLSVAFNQVHIQAAYSFFQGELVAGGGLRLLLMRTNLNDSNQLTFDNETLVSANGLGAEFGLLWQPRNQYFSVGAAFRTDITANTQFSDSLVLNDEGDVVIQSPVGPIYLPESARLPWDLHLGLVYNFGGAPPNQPWQSENVVAKRRLLQLELERFDLEREYLDARSTATSKEELDQLEENYERDVSTLDRLEEQARTDAYWIVQNQLAKRSRSTAMVTASVLLAGTADNAVGVESLRLQTVNRAGQWLTASPRLGAEIELIPDWVRVRSGVYYEPTRYETSTPRAHYTGGFDLAVAVWNVFGIWPDDYRWRAAFAIDVARDFQTWGFSIGGWYPRHRDKAQQPNPR